MLAKTVFFMIFFLNLMLPDVNIACVLPYTNKPQCRQTDKTGGSLQPVLFVHYDKSIYINNESVWFTAYLIHDNSLNKQPNVLSILLVNDENKSVLLAKRFIMSNNSAYGEVTIPNTTASGNYTLIAYSNLLFKDRPISVFRHAIIVKNVSTAAASISLKVLPSFSSNSSDSINVQIETLTTAQKPFSIRVQYHLGDQPVKYVTTSADGKSTIGFPVSDIDPHNPYLTASTIFHDQNIQSQIVLTLPRQAIHVNFYPEGGHLVHASPCVIGWKATTSAGIPVAVKGILIGDGKILDSIKTDNHGLGIFKLIPFIGKKYFVKLLKPLKDQLFALPTIIPNGPVIEINNALAGDSLKVTLISKYSGRYHVIVRNNDFIFYHFSVTVPPAGRKLLLNLKNIPKGPAVICLLDSAMNPLAQRTFFTHYADDTTIIIKTDKQVYQTKNEVHLKVRLANVPDSSAVAIVSIACVSSSRLNPAENNIVHYVYWENPFGKTNFWRPKTTGENLERNYLQKILLTQGQEYARKIMLKDSDKVSGQAVKLPVTIADYNGLILHKNRPLKKPVYLMVKTDSAANVIRTDSVGRFKINLHDLLTSNGKRVTLIVNKNNYSYNVKLFMPFDSLDQDVINNPGPLKEAHLMQFGSTAETGDIPASVLSNPNIIKLNNVMIKGNRLYDNKYSSLYSYGSNECGDYVCYLGFLNCPNHYNDYRNRPPKIGEKYAVLTSDVNVHTMTPLSNQSITDANGQRYEEIVYSGCLVPHFAQTSTSFNGLSYSKAFIPTNYSLYSDAYKNYASTIYWNHQSVLNGKSEVDVSFYTSDLTGLFTIVVQGVENNSVIYGTKDFLVEKDTSR